MTDLPMMQMWWGDFFNNARVEDLPTPEARGMWALLLGKMWLNDGWLKADDAYMAAKLGLDIRRWRNTYKPLLEPLLRREIDLYIGPIYTQKRLTAVRIAALEVRDANKARTARATAAKAAIARGKPSVTKAPPATVTSPVTKPVTTTATTTKPEPEKERTLPIKKAESSFLPTDQGLGASSGEIVASGRAPAMAASPALEGRSLPPPSERLLRSKLVRGNGHHGDAEPDDHGSGAGADPEPLPEPQRAQRTDAPVAGLFGALEAAIRASEASKDEE